MKEVAMSDSWKNCSFESILFNQSVEPFHKGGVNYSYTSRTDLSTQWIAAVKTSQEEIEEEQVYIKVCSSHKAIVWLHKICNIEKKKSNGPLSQWFCARVQCNFLYKSMQDINMKNVWLCVPRKKSHIELIQNDEIILAEPSL